MKKKITISFLLFVSIFPTISFAVEETQIGMTYFDVQTTRSMQNRIFLFEDGTIGAVFNMGMDPIEPDYMVGYNYFDGSYWGTEPYSSITSGPATNPSYTNFGENGEIVASEGANGLYINFRTEKGTGSWQEFIVAGPSGDGKLYSPQIVTSGPDNSIIHLFALDKNDNLNLQYQDNVGTVVYSRTTDGGITWDPLNQIFDFSNDYFGFSELALKVAEPVGNSMAFVVGDYFTDLIMMKSTDGGNNWEKTILVEHPYPFMEFGVMQTDTFWTHTGSMDVKLDSEEKAHVVFSLCHIASEISTIWYYDSISDGIAYWNEDMEVFSNNINALNPYGHPDSELIEDYNLVAWAQDINGNGQINILPYNVYPSLGMSTMPSLLIENNDRIFLTWSAVTETYDNGLANYRHLWARSANENGNWSGFNMLTNDLIHIFDECVFPVFAPQNNDEYLHLIYQYDVQPGLSIPEDYTDNRINHMKVPLDIIPTSFASANFEADQTEIVEMSYVNFTNYSTGYPIEDLTYLWEFEWGTPATSTETNPTVIYPYSGSYDVKLRASVTPSVYDILLMIDYITVTENTGIEINTSSFIKIHPNPSNGLITISGSMNTDVEFSIVDLLGNEVYAGSIEPGNNDQLIDLLQETSGIYFLILKTGNKIYSEKIVLRK